MKPWATKILRERLEKYGQIDQTFIGFNRFTRQRDNFATVLFTSTESATRLLQALEKDNRLTFDPIRP